MINTVGGNDRNHHRQYDRDKHCGGNQFGEPA
jgi:hypothetical protein